MTSAKTLYGLTPDEIYDLISVSEFNRRHAEEIALNLYRRKIKTIDDFVKIPKKLKSFLNSYSSVGILNCVDSELSADGAVRYLFKSASDKYFETVYIPEHKRNTVCVSVQSGCRMGCPNCVSGAYGFYGNLTAGEIVTQILGIPFASSVTHVVFMGMGEPMDNLDNVLKACEILTAQWGLAISPRNITVSTTGILPAVKRFLQESECNLTLSLHSPFAAERAKLIPAENRYPLSDLLAEMKNAKLKKGRRLSVAYMMIDGVNDSEKHLQKLISLIKGSAIRVNILPFHKIPNSILSPSPPELIQYFKHSLTCAGVSASIRKSRGEDISAACGLLAAKFSD
jgi:23S rRNA (adenine2503-C2)-methyltransferase